MVWKKKDTNEDIEEVSSIPPLPQQRKEVEKEAVVVELPQLPARRIRGEDGATYNLLTQTEAIQEILESVRAILKIAKED